ncbi:MAG: hypothetical protein RL748_4573 [Pseudomonadota bacterium]|jgi:putative toxin-antitoxin system antitoxin component (TIGR02293 family)
MSKPRKPAQPVADAAKPAFLVEQTVSPYIISQPMFPFRGNVSDVISGMRSGISAQVAPDVAQRLGLSQDKLFETLRLPKSTMKARLGKAQTLSPVEQDRMFRADRLWQRALSVFEDESATRAWIKRENRTLGGEAPLALLDTEAGYELVLDTLGRIEYGVVA